MADSTSSDFVVLHLGLGSFHRAHQAVYLQELIEAGDRRWSLVGANLRPDMADVENALRAQGGRYTLETVSPAAAYRYQRIESIREVLAYDANLTEVIARGADPRTRVVSFTVTEAGYYLDSKDHLDFGVADLAKDLERARKGQAGTTIYGAICAILSARRAANAGPITLLNCDNLRHNGDRFRKGLLEFIERAGQPELLDWVRKQTSSPNAMVDRITPRPPPELRQRVFQATGWDDAAPVTGESFIQWVIEDDFVNGRPDWGRVGVQLVDSVSPYEEAKIRILNASHSCIAWAGTLLGLQYIHEGTHMTSIRRMAFDYVTDDVIPCLHSPERPSPVDLPAYRDVVLERFGNPAIRDTNQRVAMDGFSKIPGFIAPTVHERLSRGESIDSVAMLPALFLAFLQRWHKGALPYVYQDQGMDEAAAHAICDAADSVAAMSADRTLWGDTASDARLADALRRADARVQAFIQRGGK
ncbi:mannitol dehydrogenase family protein [Variovorax sp. J2P1-59]|uniref:D-arabinitol 4-dehydrogenase n=1 Tax=Variovorax flavidus TaxID=3053501 RepID=UPI002578F77B|nr:D-arabinitol 4-dehydrogenase [Variovorax sp. J2P1-59]MDM0074029.1 mannitol dehydrogenase family protein [Variovorax sp. J2P1-59]